MCMCVCVCSTTYDGAMQLHHLHKHVLQPSHAQQLTFTLSPLLSYTHAPEHRSMLMLQSQLCRDWNTLLTLVSLETGSSLQTVNGNWSCQASRTQETHKSGPYDLYACMLQTPYDTRAKGNGNKSSFPDPVLMEFIVICEWIIQTGFVNWIRWSFKKIWLRRRIRTQIIHHYVSHELVNAGLFQYQWSSVLWSYM